MGSGSGSGSGTYRITQALSHKVQTRPASQTEASSYSPGSDPESDEHRFVLLFFSEPASFTIVAPED